MKVRVNPTCRIYWNGAYYGAGAEIDLPPAIAYQFEKDGAVEMLTASAKPIVIQKENDDDGT